MIRLPEVSMLFQFQIGAIRGVGPTIKLWAMSCFNSKLVRLEEGASTWEAYIYEFQFQIGAIRGDAFFAERVKHLRFQFQIGAIRGRIDFNEPIVRSGVSIPNWCD